MALARPIGAATTIAMPVTINDPASTVGIENWPRRGNQPSAKSCGSSMLLTNWMASKMSDSTIAALTKTERIEASRRSERASPSLRRRFAVPRRRLPLGAATVIERALGM